jgi:hypothetical protein
MRLMACGLMLLAVTSTVAAREHYVECVTPARAHQRQHFNKTHGVSTKPRLASHHVANAKPHSAVARWPHVMTTKQVANHVARRAVSARAHDVPQVNMPRGKSFRVKPRNRTVV